MLPGSAGSVLAMIGARWPAGGGVARRGATMTAGIGGGVSAQRSVLVSVAGRTLPVSVGAYCEVAERVDDDGSGEPVYAGVGG